MATGTYSDGFSTRQNGLNQSDSGQNGQGWDDDVWSSDYSQNEPSDRRSSSGFRRAGIAAVALTALGVVGVGGWYVYAAGEQTGDRFANQGTTAPLILASKDPVKVIPKEKGGLKVPHRNVEVYARIETATPEKALKKATPRAESLLPPPIDLSASNPPTPSTAPAGTIAKMSTGPASVTPNGNPSGKETLNLSPGSATHGPARNFEPAAIPAALKPTVPDVARPSIRPSVPEVIAAIPLVEPKPTRKQAAKPAAKRSTGQRTTAELIGPYRIQIGAFRNPMQAHDRWSALKRRYGDLLGGMVMVIERVNLGPRGVLYRLQAGPMQSPTDVKALCSKLSKRRIGCIMVRG